MLIDLSLTRGILSGSDDSKACGTTEKIHTGYSVNDF